MLTATRLCSLTKSTTHENAIPWKSDEEGVLSFQRCVLTCKNPGSKSAKCLNRAALCSLARMKAAVALADSVLICKRGRRVTRAEVLADSVTLAFIF